MAELIFKNRIEKLQYQKFKYISLIINQEYINRSININNYFDKNINNKLFEKFNNIQIEEFETLIKSCTDIEFVIILNIIKMIQEKRNCGILYYFPYDFLQLMFDFLNPNELAFIYSIYEMKNTIKEYCKRKNSLKIKNLTITIKTINFISLYINLKEIIVTESTILDFFKQKPICEKRLKLYKYSFQTPDKFFYKNIITLKLKLTNTNFYNYGIPYDIEDFNFLEDFKKLETIDLYFVTIINTKILNYLFKIFFENKTVKNLKLYYDECLDFPKYTIKGLCSNILLETLTITENHFGFGDEFKNLINLKSLTIIDRFLNSRLTNNVTNFLTFENNIEFLHFESPIDKGSILNIIQCKKLKYLYIIYDPELLDYLKKHNDPCFTHERDMSYISWEYFLNILIKLPSNIKIIINIVKSIESEKLLEVNYIIYENKIDKIKYNCELLENYFSDLTIYEIQKIVKNI